MTALIPIMYQKSILRVPTVVKQCHQYETYRRSGREQERLGTFPLVIWFVNDESRLQRLYDAIAAARDLDQALFRGVLEAEFIDLVCGHASRSGGEAPGVE